METVTLGDLGQFVGQLDGHLAARHACHRSGQPTSKAIVRPEMGTHHNDPCRLDQEQPQITAAPFGDPAKDGATVSTELLRDQPDPSRKIPTAVIPRIRMSSIIRWRSGEILSSPMRTSCLSIESVQSSGRSGRHHMHHDHNNPEHQPRAPLPREPLRPWAAIHECGSGQHVKCRVAH